MMTINDIGPAEKVLQNCCQATSKP